MATPRIVDREEWLAARKALLQKEKAFSRTRDDLARERRDLPWVRIDKAYAFEGPQGRLALGDLFGGKGQLLVYHFMMGPDWTEGCPSCSFWADNYNGVDVHLAHRDTALAAVSRAPLAKIEAYRKRMGWTFRWVSSAGSDFNFDFGVSFDPAKRGDEAPGLSAFRRGDDGAIYHTYSTYSRGLDMFNGAYQMLDLTAKGRDEEGLPWPMAWVRRHDSY
jgi:predicted dithiol-disulfide oxidoreductase (DUF899 family)